MLLSQKIGNFTKGDADVLRKAMGKKIREVIDKMKGKFIEGGKENGHPEDKLNKVWTDWEAFAQYAFNKSHSTCYAFVAYQTGYLKANYPNEFMAAVLSNSLGNIDKITFFMEECKRMGIPLLGPDVNESERMFTVTNKGIRFGMGAIKGVGDAAVESIMEERSKNGQYKDIYDFVTRVNSRTVNKKNIESLALAGALDNLGEFKRAQFFHEDEDKTTFIEKLVRFGSKASESKQTYEISLFGEEIMGNTLAQPTVPDIPEWNIIQKLKFEKEVVGVYISGHPLDEYRYEIKTFCNSTLKELESRNGSVQKIAGIVSKVQVRTSANGNQFMIFSIEDFSDSHEFALFGKDFIAFEKYIAQDRLIYIQGSMQPRFRNSTEMSFKIQSIQLLSEVLEDNSNEVKIKISTDSLNLELLEKLEKTIDQNKGNKKLLFEVIDYKEKIKLDFLARTKQVNINKNLLKSLEKISDIEIKLS
jgi:DNA polymerase-3 subunit alpha